MVKKWLILDLDETLIDWDANLLINNEVLNRLIELHETQHYGLALASFNDSATEILQHLQIDRLFSIISGGIKPHNYDIHTYSFSKVDNILEIMRTTGQFNPDDYVFLDNEYINCLHVSKYLGVPHVEINPATGITMFNIDQALDYLDKKENIKI